MNELNGHEYNYLVAAVQSLADSSDVKFHMPNFSITVNNRRSRILSRRTIGLSPSELKLDEGWFAAENSRFRLLLLPTEPPFYYKPLIPKEDWLNASVLPWAPELLMARLPAELPAMGKLVKEMKRWGVPIPNAEWFIVVTCQPQVGGWWEREPIYKFAFSPLKEQVGEVNGLRVFTAADDLEKWSSRISLYIPPFTAVTDPHFVVTSSHQIWEEPTYTAPTGVWEGYWVWVFRLYNLDENITVTTSDGTITVNIPGPESKRLGVLTLPM